MSLKIYNGYKFKNNMSLIELNGRMIKLRETFRFEAIRLYKKILMNNIYLNEDLYKIDKEFAIKYMKNSGLMYETISEENAIISIAVNTHYNLQNISLKH